MRENGEYWRQERVNPSNCGGWGAILDEWRRGGRILHKLRGGRNVERLEGWENKVLCTTECYGFRRRARPLWLRRGAHGACAALSGAALMEMGLQWVVVGV